MSVTQITMRGTVKPDGTLALEEKVTLPPGPVEVIVRQLEETGSHRPDLANVIEQIRKEREARAEKGLSEEELEATIAELRDDSEYEEKWRQIWAQTEMPPKSTQNP